MKNRKIGVNWDLKVLHQIKREQKDDESFSRCVNRLMNRKLGATPENDVYRSLSKKFCFLFKNEYEKISKKSFKSFKESLTKKEDYAITSILEGAT